MYIRYETDAYRLSKLNFGMTLERKSDGKSAFFQGDDEVLWRHNMDAIESIRQWNAGNTLDKSFDFLCSGYDDILR